MKNYSSALVAILFLVLGSIQSIAQVQDIQLVQTEGAFQTEQITILPGKYQFEIFNDGIDKEVGFVLVPKGKYEAKDHIKSAYVTSPVGKDQSSKTNVVQLTPGEYEYFCPLNPTPKYSLKVADKVETIKLTQVPGDFTTKNLSLTEGDYQFEIANDGIDHEVGFVVVPKGKYDPQFHIKSAYVKAPVSSGNSSTTQIVTLEAGEYEYFCPLNPTPKYSITVK